jgi:hypothetical protein
MAPPLFNLLNLLLNNPSIMEIIIYLKIQTKLEVDLMIPYLNYYSKNLLNQRKILFIYFI